jgi:hypothetical protein
LWAGAGAVFPLRQLLLASLLGGGPSLLHRRCQPLSSCRTHRPAARCRSTLRCSTRSASPFCRPASFGSFDDSSAALRAQVSLTRLAICAWRCYFCQGTLPRYLPKSRYGAIDGRSLRLKLRNDILDVIHARSFLWQLNWDLSNSGGLVANCLCNLTTRSCLSARIRRRMGNALPSQSSQSVLKIYRKPRKGAKKVVRQKKSWVDSGSGNLPSE